MRRSYHTFRGFDIGLKMPSRWIATPDLNCCPYCAEWSAKQIGQVQSEGQTYTLWECQTEPCRKMYEGRQAGNKQPYIRYQPQEPNP